MDISILSIILTLIFTGLLVLFGCLQWRAIEKQNKQNLFKLRMEHYVKYKNFVIDTVSLFIKEDNGKHFINIDKREHFLVQLKILVILFHESRYLFNNNISSLEEQILEEHSVINDLIRSGKMTTLNIDQNMQLINDIDRELNKEFDKVLSKIK